MGPQPARAVLWLVRIGVGGLVLQMVAGLAGVSRVPSPRAVLVAAAVAGISAAASPWTSGDERTLRVAATLALVGAVVSGAVGGWGALEVSVAVVSVAAILGASRVEALSRLPWHRILAVGGIVLVTVALVRIATVDRILGHDEAAYALRARAFVAGTPTTGFRVARPIGLPVLISPLVGLTGDERVLRLVGVVFGVAAVAVIGWMASRLGGAWAAWAAAGTTVAAVEFMRRAAELLTDVSSTALLLATVAVLWRQFEERETPGPWLLAAGPLAAGAFYLRYQSVLALAGIVVAGLVLWRRSLAGHRRLVAGTAAVAGVLVVPHFVYAASVTGSPLGLLSVSATTAVRSFVGEGFVDYARMFPVDLFGPAGAVLMVAALVGGMHRLVRGRAGPVGRFEVMAWTVTAAVVVPLGIVSHGEPRFVFFPVVMLVVAGAAEAVTWIRARTAALRRVLAGSLSVLLVGLVATTTVRLVRSRHVIAERGMVVAEAAEAIVADAGGRSCGVLTSTEPQITWYTGCFTSGFGNVPRPGAERRLAGEVRYLLLYEGGKRQPEGEVLDAYLALTDGPPVVIHDPTGQGGDAFLYRLANSP